MAQTLAELKAENAKAEAANSTDPQTVEEVTEVEAVEDELTETEEIAESPEGEVSEDDTGQEVEAETEEWMRGDESESQADDKKFTDSDIGKAKAKLRAKLEDKHNTETEQLRAEIEELKKGTVRQEPIGQKPKRSDFFDHDDPDEAFINASLEYRAKQENAERQAKNAANQSRQAQQAITQQREASVDQHYERVVHLAKKSGIEADTYRSAEMRVRQMIESVRPKQGDLVADILIDSVGEGSEKVFFNLGVNSAKLKKLKDIIQNDPPGFKAVAYVAGLAKELNKPEKRQTTAPKPATSIKGDGAGLASTSALQNKYNKLHSSGQANKALKLKRSAKKQGANTSNW